MSNASANSSTRTSKEEVKQNLNNIRVVGGPLSVEKGKNNEYSIIMNPEYVLDYSTPLTLDLVKNVGSHEIVVNKAGKVTKRVDEKAGISYVTGKNGKIAVKHNKEPEK